MKKWMMIFGLGLMALTGCVRDEVPYYLITDADVYFDY
ncbi:MAG: hypothetical protein RLZZ337_454 [Bacteroidota bacterium]|jgi:hypothetical protein